MGYVMGELREHGKMEGRKGDWQTKGEEDSRWRQNENHDIALNRRSSRKRSVSPSFVRQQQQQQQQRSEVNSRSRLDTKIPREEVVMRGCEDAEFHLLQETGQRRPTVSKRRADKGGEVRRQHVRVASGRSSSRKKHESVSGGSPHRGVASSCLNEVLAIERQLSTMSPPMGDDEHRHGLLPSAGEGEDMNRGLLNQEDPKRDLRQKRPQTVDDVEVPFTQAEKKYWSFKMAEQAGRTVCVCGASSYYERERFTLLKERSKLRENVRKVIRLYNQGTEQLVQAKKEAQSIEMERQDLAQRTMDLHLQLEKFDQDRQKIDNAKVVLSDKSDQQAQKDAELKSREADLQQLIGQVESARAENEKQLMELEEARQDLRRRSSELSSLEEHLEDLRKRITSTSDVLDQEKEALEADVAKLNERERNIKAKEAELEDVADDFKRVEEVIRERMEKVRDKEMECQTREEEMAEDWRGCLKLKEELEGEAKNLEDVRLRLDDDRRKLEVLQGETEKEVQKKLKEAEAELEKAERESEEKRREIQSWVSTVEKRAREIEEVAQTRAREWEERMKNEDETRCKIKREAEEEAQSIIEQAEKETAHLKQLAETQAAQLKEETEAVVLRMQESCEAQINERLDELTSRIAREQQEHEQRLQRAKARLLADKRQTEEMLEARMRETEKACENRLRETKESCRVMTETAKKESEELCAREEKKLAEKLDALKMEKEALETDRDLARARLSELETQLNIREDNCKKLETSISNREQELHIREKNFKAQALAAENNLATQHAALKDEMKTFEEKRSRMEELKEEIELREKALGKTFVAIDEEHRLLDEKAQDVEMKELRLADWEDKLQRRETEVMMCEKEMADAIKDLERRRRDLEMAELKVQQSETAVAEIEAAQHLLNLKTTQFSLEKDRFNEVQTRQSQAIERQLTKLEEKMEILKEMEDDLARRGALESLKGENRSRTTNGTMVPELHGALTTGRLKSPDVHIDCGNSKTQTGLLPHTRPSSRLTTSIFPTNKTRVFRSPLDVISSFNKLEPAKNLLKSPEIDPSRIKTAANSNFQEHLTRSEGRLQNLSGPSLSGNSIAAFPSRPQRDAIRRFSNNLPIPQRMTKGGGGGVSTSRYSRDSAECVIDGMQRAHTARSQTSGTTDSSVMEDNPREGQGGSDPVKSASFLTSESRATDKPSSNSATQCTDMTKCNEFNIPTTSQLDNLLFKSSGSLISSPRSNSSSSERIMESEKSIPVSSESSSLKLGKCSGGTTSRSQKSRSSADITICRSSEVTLSDPLPSNPIEIVNRRIYADIFRSSPSAPPECNRLNLEKTVVMQKMETENLWRVGPTDLDKEKKDTSVEDALNCSTQSIGASVHRSMESPLLTSLGKVQNRQVERVSQFDCVQLRSKVIDLVFASPVSHAEWKTIIPGDENDPPIQISNS